jgi:hypothetical protein
MTIAMPVSSFAATSRAGASRIRMTLCNIELSAHRVMLLRLQHLFDSVQLSPSQAQAVRTEIAARDSIVRQLERQRHNARQLASRYE